MCWEKKTHLSKGLCGSEPYIAPELFDQKGKSPLSSSSTSRSRLRHRRLLVPKKGEKQVRGRSGGGWGRSRKHASSSSSSARHQLTKPEYDARLVDVWAAAIVFYCMQFQELPWRVAKSSDPTFSAYTAAYSPNPNTIGGSMPGPHPTPPPLNNLVPRECRNVIKHMLDPDPKTRWTIDEALKDKWMESINVCKEGEVNDHTHVKAGLYVGKV